MYEEFDMSQWGRGQMVSNTEIESSPVSGQIERCCGIGFLLPHRSKAPHMGPTAQAAPISDAPSWHETNRRRKSNRSNHINNIQQHDMPCKWYTVYVNVQAKVILPVSPSSCPVGSNWPCHVLLSEHHFTNPDLVMEPCLISPTPSWIPSNLLQQEAPILTAALIAVAVPIPLVSRLAPSKQVAPLIGHANLQGSQAQGIAKQTAGFLWPGCSPKSGDILGKSTTVRRKTFCWAWLSMTYLLIYWTPFPTNGLTHAAN